MSMSLPETWQDWIVAIGSLFFFLALLPSILGVDKPSVWTSGLTAIVLTAFTAVYWSFDLMFGTTTTVLATIGWYILFFQRVHFSKPLFYMGSILQRIEDGKYVQIRNVRKVRPELMDGSREEKQWVYDGVVIHICGNGTIEYCTGFSCSPENAFRPVSGLS